MAQRHIYGRPPYNSLYTPPFFFHFFPPLLRVHALYGVSVSYVVWILGWRGSGVFSVPWMHANGVFFLDGKGAVKIGHNFHYSFKS